MSGMLAHYEGKLQVLLSWSKELALSSNSEVSRGLLSLVLHKFDELNEFTSYIRGLFSVRDGEHSRSDSGILADGEDAANVNDRPSRRSTAVTAKTRILPNSWKIRMFLKNFAQCYTLNMEVTTILIQRIQTLTIKFYKKLIFAEFSFTSFSPNLLNFRINFVRCK